MQRLRTANSSLREVSTGPRSRSKAFEPSQEASYVCSTTAIHPSSPKCLLQLTVMTSPAACAAPSLRSSTCLPSELRSDHSSGSSRSFHGPHVRLKEEREARLAALARNARLLKQQSLSRNSVSLPLLFSTEQSGQAKSRAIFPLFLLSHHRSTPLHTRPASCSFPHFSVRS